MYSQLFNRTLTLTAGLLIASPAMAYLGSFEQADGYHFLNDGIPNNWIDVSNYNAGQHGANAGGGSSAPIVPNSGLWQCLGEPGSFFPNSALRNSYIGSVNPPGTPYPTSGSIPSSDMLGAYVIGDHPGGRTGDALGLRNVGPVGNGPIEYDYTLDSYDFGGTPPASVTSGPIQVGFWFWPSNKDTPPSQDKFIMSFTDSIGNIGFQWGYNRDNEIYWRPGSSGSWNMTGLDATDPNSYNGMTIVIDLTSQNFSIQYYDISSNVTTNLATGYPLGATMSDFTHIGWWLTDNTLAGPGGWGGKNFFDDFTFKPNVPEPTGLPVTLLLLGCGVISRRRRRGGSSSNQRTH